METPPNLQVYDLGHLGLVASVLDRIRLVETVDRLVGPRPGEKVSTGMALKAAILNALGFVASPLYLFGHPFQGKPTEHLLGPGVTPDLLNDDRMGRMLDTLYAAGVTEVFLEVAREARQAFPFPVQALHVDSTSFHVYGQYEGLGEEVGAIRVTHGYSRDHRPDLKQWVMNLVCADTGGFPPSSPPGTETSRTGRPWRLYWPATARPWTWGRWWCWTGRGTAGRTSGPWRGSPGSYGCPLPSRRPGPCWKGGFREKLGPLCSRGTGGWRWRRTTGG
jgi:hypothetical protein